MKMSVGGDEFFPDMCSECASTEVAGDVKMVWRSLISFNRDAVLYGRLHESQSLVTLIYKIPRGDPASTQTRGN